MVWIRVPQASPELPPHPSVLLARPSGLSHQAKQDGREGARRAQPCSIQQAGQVSHTTQEAGVGGGDVSFARWGRG